MSVGELVFISVIVMSIVAAFAYVQLHDRNSSLRSWLWCRKHGLKLKSIVVGYGGGAVLWWGEDKEGREFVPDENGNPQNVSKE